MNLMTRRKIMPGRAGILAATFLVPGILIMALLLAAGCASGDNPAGSSSDRDYIYLATTTSTYDSGLMDALLPGFTVETGIEVRVMALATGQAMEVGKRGDVDLIFVHDRGAELKLVEEGYFVDRFDVMYNDFVLLGPPGDPAGVREWTDVVKALQAVAADEFPFISRGDDSGTHRREMSLWAGAGLDPTTGGWYYRLGQGMAGTLRMANEVQGYTLSDRGTYLSLKNMLDLEIVSAGDPQLINQYGVMAVNPQRHFGVNYGGSRAFIDYLQSPKGQDALSSFTIEGETLFFPGQPNQKDEEANR